MEFQRARTQEQVADRRNEIMNACVEIYEAQGIAGITFGKIAEKTSFTRQSIYNYYNSREEILLDVLKREYAAWGNELAEAFSTGILDREGFCRVLAHTLAHRETMMRLLSVNMSIIETQCSLDHLTDFKCVAAITIGRISAAEMKFFPNASEKSRRLFLSLFLAFIEGAFPVTHLSEKQRTAMLAAGMNQDPRDFEELCYSGAFVLSSCLV